MSYVDLSEQVKSVRKAAGLTQTDFADKLGVHPQTVSKWERGKTAPDVSQLGDIADVCGVTLEKLLDKANITANKNAIPFDPLKPMTTSGLRIGTPAMTTRGLREADMDQVADFIVRIIRGGEEAVEGVKTDVIAMCERFPLYEGDVLDI